jgi:arylsulfatase A-like enzyme
MAQILETPGRGAAGAAGGDFVELDRGVPEMAFDFCGTLAELQRDLQGDVKEPFFAHSRSLNLHVAAIRASAAPAGEAYPGFEPRYASRVHRLDACFGTFIEFLKRRGLYDRSIVILTADHGEELGEDGRWGHAYYLFPSVLRVPLLMHLPKALAGAVAVDPDAAAFLTDVTPTLYAALGYRPERATPLVGEPLIGPPGTRFSARRHSTEVVIASYGAVYGVLTRNGDRLYIIDANHRQEYAYSRRAGDWIAAPITPPFRASSQRAIREFVEEIALEYQVRR